MPSLITAYTGSANGPVTTPSFSPAAGELIVVKGATGNVNWNIPNDSASALTFTQRISQFGFVQSKFWTAPVVTAPGPITITLSTQTTGFTIIYAVERWSGAKLATSPATDDETFSGVLPSGTITTAKSGSVVSWAAMQVSTGQPSAYVTTSATPVQEFSNFTASYLYQAAPSAGVQNYGVTAASGTPANWVWQLLALEIQAAPQQASGNWFALM